MGCCVSETGVVGVEHALLHVLALLQFGQEEPQKDHCDDAFPHSVADLVPHLVVKSVDLL